MKKLITICLFITITFNLNAQVESVEARKLNVKDKIIDLMDKAQNVYTSSGSYNKVTGYGFNPPFDCILYFYQYSGTVKSDENDNKQGYRKGTIDFSKITLVKSSRTNFGYKCIAFYGTDIGSQYTNPDQYGNHSPNSYTEMKMNSEISMAIDNDELVDLFKEYNLLCLEDKKVNAEKYNNYAKSIADYENKREIEKQYYAEKNRKSENRETIFYVLAAVLGFAVSLLALL